MDGGSMSSWGMSDGGAFSGSDSWNSGGSGSMAGWGMDGDGAFSGSDFWGTGDMGAWGLGDMGADWNTPNTPGAFSPLDAPEDDFFSKLKNVYGQFSQSPLGKATKMGLSVANPALAGIFGVADMGMAASAGKGNQAMGEKFGNTVQGMLGPVGQLGNMFGVGLGNEMGKSFAGVPSYSGPATTDNKMGGGYGGAQTQTPFGSFTLGSNTNAQDYGKTMMGLASLWAQRNNMNNMKSNANGLATMYGRNGAPAKQLAQTLARKDAAAGRRSQYGPREVELQAKLAGLRSQNAPYLNAMYGNIGTSENNFYAQLANMYGNGGFGG